MSGHGRAEKDGRPVFRRCAWFQNEKGVALVTSLLVLVLLALLAPVIVRKTSDDLKRTENFKESRTAFYIAEAGLEQAKKLLASSTINGILAGPDGSSATTADNGTFTIAGGVAVTIDSNKYTQVSFNGGTYSVRLFNNTDSGSTWSDSDSIAFIESIGIYKSSTGTLKAMVAKTNLDPSLVPAAMTMVGGLPHAQIDGQGSGWLVSGNAVDTSGHDDATCADQYGIATQDGSPALSWGGNADTKVQGIGGGTPSILTGETAYTLAQAQALYNKVVGSAITYNGGSFSGTQTWGTDVTPRVTRISGQASITGNISGTGILLIDGDTAISGSLNFHGLVLIGANPGGTQAQLSGTGSGTIYGALVMGNTNQSQAQLTGNGNIQYSCQALAYATNLAGSSLAVVSWQQVQ